MKSKMFFLVVAIAAISISAFAAKPCPQLSALLNDGLATLPADYSLTCDKIVFLRDGKAVKQFIEEYKRLHPEMSQRDVDEIAKSSMFTTAEAMVYVRGDAKDYIQAFKLYNFQPEHRQALASIWGANLYHESVHVVQLNAKVPRTELPAYREQLRVLDLAVSKVSDPILSDFVKDFHKWYDVTFKTAVALK